MSKILDQTLPRSMSYEWTDLAYQQIISGNTTTIVFALCVLFVFLALAAQYESLVAATGDRTDCADVLAAGGHGVLLDHGDNNIFMQIGLLVLVGLACKNAILIVEFAKHLQEEHDHDARSAALEAARLRLRPILMTSIAFVMGVGPLVLAHGAGAEVRHAMGVTVFAGMIGVTAFGLLLTPIFYVFMRRLAGRSGAASEAASVASAAAAVATSGPENSFTLRLTMIHWSIRTGAVLCAIGYLTACAVGPNYQRPRTPVTPVSWALRPPIYSSQVAQAQFWAQSADATLDGLVNDALTANHDLRIALGHLAEARALRHESLYDLAPTVTFSGSHQTQQVPKVVAGYAYKASYDDASFDAYWELDLFGRSGAVSRQVRRTCRAPRPICATHRCR